MIKISFKVSNPQSYPHKRSKCSRFPSPEQLIARHRRRKGNFLYPMADQSIKIEGEVGESWGLPDSRGGRQGKGRRREPRRRRKQLAAVVFSLAESALPGGSFLIIGGLHVRHCHLSATRSLIEEKRAPRSHVRVLAAAIQEENKRQRKPTEFEAWKQIFSLRRGDCK